MGLLDYYRQFDEMDPSEANRLLREERARERALALERVPVMDLSGTEWPDMPNPEVVSASVYQARGRLNGYPDHHATGLRRALAERHYIKASQIVFGNGAAELLQTAAYLLLSEGDEVITPWPSYALYLAIAARAGARTVAVDLKDARIDPAALLSAVTERTRLIFVCNPNDPTGTYLDSHALGDMLGRLPDRVHVLLDEAYVHFQEIEEEDACLKLVEAFPHLLVFRTFSKIFGLSGLRAGYVVASSASASLLAALEPLLGVNALTQAAIAQALGAGGRDLWRRREAVLTERARLLEGLGELPVSVADSQANFVWLGADGLGGDELARRLEQSHVRVACGGPLGDEDHVRAAIRDAAATNRLLWGLGETLA